MSDDNTQMPKEEGTEETTQAPTEGGEAAAPAEGGDATSA